MAEIVEIVTETSEAEDEISGIDSTIFGKFFLYDPTHGNNCILFHQNLEHFLYYDKEALTLLIQNYDSQGHWDLE